LTLCAGEEIGVEDLQLRASAIPGGTESASGSGASRAATAAPSAPAGAALGDQLEHIERDAILKALAQTRYNKTAAARLLGITFRALRYKIKKLGIE
jgi:two-component system, NtrC family, response regulator PilR